MRSAIKLPATKPTATTPAVIELLSNDDSVMQAYDAKTESSADASPATVKTNQNDVSSNRSTDEI